MKRTLVSSLLMLVAITPLAQTPQNQGSTTPDDAATQKAGMVKVADAIRESWQTAWNTGQLDQVAALYAQNAVLLAPDGERVTGRDAIRAYLQRVVDQRKSQISASSTSQISISSVSSEMCGELGVDSGTYKETIKWPTTSLTLTGVGGGGSKEIEGSYLVVIKRYDSSWLIQEHAATQQSPTAKK